MDNFVFYFDEVRGDDKWVIVIGFFVVVFFRVVYGVVDGDCFGDGFWVISWDVCRFIDFFEDCFNRKFKIVIDCLSGIFCVFCVIREVWRYIIVSMVNISKMGRGMY